MALSQSEAVGADGKAVSNSQDYRRFAARCLEIERHASDAQTQALMLQMAQICHRLADELDAAHKNERDAPRDAAPTGADGAGA
jgi:hypothetical protein